MNDIVKYIYRFAIDNYEKSGKNSTNVIVRNIFKYEPSGLKEFTLNHIKTWNEFGEGILSLSSTQKISIIVEELTNDDINYLNTVFNLIVAKSIGNEFKYTTNINQDIRDVLVNKKNDILDINQLDLINETRFWNRAVEKIKYCLCCDDIYIDNLKAVPIVAESKQDLIALLSMEDNSLVFCNTHYELYKNRFFKFDSQGKIVILKNNSYLDKRMSVSKKILSEKRKNFLQLIEE